MSNDSNKELLEEHRRKVRSHYVTKKKPSEIYEKLPVETDKNYLELFAALTEAEEELFLLSLNTKSFDEDLAEDIKEICDDILDLVNYQVVPKCWGKTYNELMEIVGSDYAE